MSERLTEQHLRDLKGAVHGPEDFDEEKRALLDEVERLQQIIADSANECDKRSITRPTSLHADVEATHQGAAGIPALIDRIDLLRHRIMRAAFKFESLGFLSDFQALKVEFEAIRKERQSELDMP